MPFNTQELHADLSKEEVVASVNAVLSSIECLRRRQYDTYGVSYWSLEYGTMPFHLTLDPKMYAIHSQYFPASIANEAKERFPELHEGDNDDNFEGMEYPPRGWGVFILSLEFFNERFRLQIERTDGCGNTYYFFTQVLNQIAMHANSKRQ